MSGSLGKDYIVIVFIFVYSCPKNICTEIDWTLYLVLGLRFTGSEILDPDPTKIPKTLVSKYLHVICIKLSRYCVRARLSFFYSPEGRTACELRIRIRIFWLDPVFIKPGDQKQDPGIRIFVNVGCRSELSDLSYPKGDPYSLLTPGSGSQIPV